MGVYAEAPDSSLTRQLPYNVPFSAKVALIERLFRDWESHYLRCFAVVHEATLDELKQLVEHHFGRFTATPLLDHVNSIIEEQVEQCRSKTIEKMQWMLELENPPFTNNDHYFSSNRDKYLARYKEVRAVSSFRWSRLIL